MKYTKITWEDLCIILEQKRIQFLEEGYWIRTKFNQDVPDRAWESMCISKLDGVASRFTNQPVYVKTVDLLRFKDMRSII